MTFSPEMKISRFGFGCSRLFSERNEKISYDLIEQCLNSGISHFDTAPSYGTEKLLGRVLGNNNNITIATKVGIKRKEISKEANYLKKIILSSKKKIIDKFPIAKNKILKNFNKTTDYRINEKRKLSKEEIILELEISLKNLKRDNVDILLIHEPDQFFLDDELHETLNGIKKDGYIKEYGLGYGRSEVDHNFGRVVQQKYSKNNVFFKDKINIYHGLLRNLLNENKRDFNLYDAFRNISKEHKDSYFLFSASRAEKIKRLMD